MQYKDSVMRKVSVLLVDDEYDFGFILKQYLEMSGFEVYWFQNPLDVLEQKKVVQNCSVAILDVMMPDMDGFTLAKKIREFVRLPFLFLTAKNQQIDRILGLKLGADDYVSKPCDPEELILRLNNILKRANTGDTSTEYNLGNYRFKPGLLLLEHEKEQYQLTERESALLLLLVQYNKKLITREIILNNVWKSTDYFTGRSMDVFISRLRKYLQFDDRIRIQSIRGIGFQVYFPEN